MQENVLKNKKNIVPRTSKRRGTILNRYFRYLYLRFIRLRCSDVEVAKGIALGVFIGMTPTMGIQVPLALFFAMLLKENKIAAILGVFVTNPVTVIPIYSLNFFIGKYLLGTPNLEMPHFNSAAELLNLSKNFLIPLFFGGCVLGLISAIVAYFLAIKVYTALNIKIINKDKKARSNKI